MRFASAFASVLCVCLSHICASHSARFRVAPPPRQRRRRPPSLPAVEVIQKQGPAVTSSRPVQKKTRAKKTGGRRFAAAAAPAARQHASRPERSRPNGADNGAVHMSPVRRRDPECRARWRGRGHRDRARKVRRVDSSRRCKSTCRASSSATRRATATRGTLHTAASRHRPVNGRAQGLAVYQNGVRINETFGDIVNWDFLPSNAIDGMSIVGANPVVRPQRPGRCRSAS